MDKIPLKQKCEFCDTNLTLLLSIREEDKTLWLIKKCEGCTKRLIEEVLQITYVEE